MDATGKTPVGMHSTDSDAGVRHNRRPLAKPNTGNYDELGPRERVLPTGQVSERSPRSSPRRFFNIPSSPPGRCHTLHSNWGPLRVTTKPASGPPSTGNQLSRSGSLAPKNWSPPPPGAGESPRIPSPLPAHPANPVGSAHPAPPTTTAQRTKSYCLGEKNFFHSK